MTFGSDTLSFPFAQQGAAPAQPHDAASAAKMRNDITVALDILYRPASAFAYNLVMTRDTNALVTSLSNHAALSEALSFRSRLDYFGHGSSDLRRPPQMSTLSNSCMVPAFSVTAPDGGSSTSVGTIVLDLYQRDTSEISALTSPRLPLTGSEFFCGFYILDNVSGDLLLILHPVAKESAKDVTFALFTSFPSTSARMEIALICNTELFRAGLFEQSCYYARSFVQSVPCIVCGSPPDDSYCGCTVKFSVPQHPLDYIPLWETLTAHRAGAVSGDATVVFRKMRTNWTVPPYLQRYRTWWESTTGQNFPICSIYTPLMTTTLRFGPRQMYRANSPHSLVRNLVSRALYELTHVSAPSRGMPAIPGSSDSFPTVLLTSGPQDANAAGLRTHNIASGQLATETRHDRRGAIPVSRTRTSIGNNFTPCAAEPEPANNLRLLADTNFEADAITQGMDIRTSGPIIKANERDKQAQLRRQRNRDSAARSNLMRKVKTEKLKSDVSAARDQLMHLNAKREALASENLALKSRAAELWKAQLRRRNA
jgi:hypothetical protein